MNVIGPFQGEYSFLSNMYPCKIIYDGKLFRSSEALYQTFKIDPARTDWIEAIRLCERPEKAKRMVKKKDCPLKKYTPKEWNFLRLAWMRISIREKFEQNPDLMEKLLDTGDAEIVELNHWNDTFFGRCDGVGENHLGKILMNLRDGPIVRAYV